MADWDNSRWTYQQVLNGETGIYYMKDDKLRAASGVKIMQTKLNAAGFNTGTPDGKFGAGTDTAVRTFQRAKGLTASVLTHSYRNQFVSRIIILDTVKSA